MQISVIIPLLNEQESIPELHDWIVSVMQSNSFSYEILFIDDGSTDDSWELIDALSRKHTHTKGIKFQNNYGKSQALHAGFAQVRGDVVITMDADLQDSPDEIPELYDMIIKGNYDIVSGWKQKRYDSVIGKNLPSKLFNWAARRTSGIYLHDFNCGLKAYRKDVVKAVDVHGEMHRYIPVLAKNAGFKNITEKVVIHQARKYGVSKFGYSRFLNGFLDLVTLWFLGKFGRRPMHFFGAVGLLMFIIGFVLAGYIGSIKIYRMANDLPYSLVTDNPYFYIALTTMVLGTLFFIAGFLGELILRTARKAGGDYTIEKTID